MKFGLFYKNKDVLMKVDAKNENCAWEKMKKAGVKNKSKEFTLKNIDGQVDKSFMANSVKNVIGSKVELPTKDSYKMNR